MLRCRHQFNVRKAQLAKPGDQPLRDFPDSLENHHWSRVATNPHASRKLILVHCASFVVNAAQSTAGRSIENSMVEL